ncbi:M23 family metallopeptidase [Thermanaeromonas sp. C210]|uniref:M23 family metallopeptidase n=1 Tax=Thermanaeromonas sp. C210 TaxID=2731925 RepID=UPI001C2567DC|nr:M23 family metallopeptidase [Thermanaeromonas sp. C210]
MILLAGWRLAVAPNAWAVVVEGERVAVAASREEAQQAVENLLAAMGKGGYEGVQLAETIEYLPVKVDRGAINTPEELERLLAGRISFKVPATALEIDGVSRALLRDEATAVALLERLKKEFVPGEGAMVEEVKFKEKVSLVRQLAAPEDIASPDEVLALLKEGTEEVRQYTVQEGDCLWTIAQKFDLPVEKLQEANPQIQGERLDIGQVINLSARKPLLNVVVVYRQEVTESIPYPTEVKTTSQLWRGQERVKQAGVEGEKKVTYRVVAENGRVVGKEVLEAKVLKEPVTRIVERGTKVQVALAARGGSGRLAWPVSGPISSPYGYRGGEFHSGLDIAASYGTAVGAAEDGVVTQVGYMGGYGRMVTIDHGGGLVTRYAHLSGYNVKTGQRVSRGQIVGYVGTSGRTTGPHLHLEVLVDGEFRNPYQYLR